MATTDTPSSRVARKMRVRALLFLLLALVAGLAAIFLIQGYLKRMELLNSERLNATVKIVVAKANIPIATELAELHVETVDWPARHVLDGSYSSVEEVLGKTVRQNLVKGEPILNERLADEDVGRGLAAILADGIRAMAVKVDQVIGVAGFVQPGDYVDVIVVMRPDVDTREQLKLKAEVVSKVILQKVPVLAIGQHVVNQGNKPKTVQVVTLALTPNEAERLALASRHGVIQLTMRSRVDVDPIPTAGVTPVALLQPDENAEIQPIEKPKVIFRAKRKRRPEVDEAAKKPETIVEILRGGEIEERKLRPSADTRRQNPADAAPAATGGQ